MATPDRDMSYHPDFADRVEDIYTSAGLAPSELPEQTRRVVDWLAGWDAHVFHGVCALLQSAYVAGYRQQRGYRREAEQAVRDDPLTGA